MFASQAKPKTSAELGPVSPDMKGAPAATSAHKPSPSIIGQDLVLSAGVVSKGDIQVLGRIEGDVRCKSILIGDDGTVVGEIRADDVVVRGRVDGLIRGQRVTLQAGSHVEADVLHQSFSLEQGAFFEGRSRRVDVASENMTEVKTPNRKPDAVKATADHSRQIVGSRQAAK